MSKKSQIGPFNLGTFGAATVIRANPAENAFISSAASPKPPSVGERTRSNENQYSCCNGCRYVDFQVWNQKGKDADPIGFSSKNEPPTPRYRPETFTLEQLQIESPLNLTLRPKLQESWTEVRDLLTIWICQPFLAIWIC